MERILVDPESIVDLLYLPDLFFLGYKLNKLRNPKRALDNFNGSQANSLEEIVFSISARLVTSLVPLTVIEKHSFFNPI